LAHKDYKYIGKNVSKVDGFAKVTGEAKYVGDLFFPGMLYGKILYSQVAHAEITGIDVSKAVKLPGVKVVLTYEDAPKNKYTPTGHPYPDDTPLDMLILSKRVRYVGEPVAAVAAVTEEIAKEAAALIEVEYKELPRILTIEEAQARKIEIHEGTKNIAGQTSYEIGRLNEGFNQSDYVFDDKFETQIVQHCSLETHVSIVTYELDGSLVVYSSTQIPFTLRRLLSNSLQIPVGKIKVVKPFVGGGFGSKQDMCQEAINALLAIKARKPVKLEFDREEDMVSSRTRHSMSLEVKTGVTKEGKILARQLKVCSNTGAYSSQGHAVTLNISSVFPVLYPAPNLGFEGTTYYTNLPVAGAMRGYGIPQLTFAVEAHMDNIANKLNLDPIKFRLLNMCQKGYINPTNGVCLESFALPDIIELGRGLSKWHEKRVEETREVDESVRRGTGMACFAYASCTTPDLCEVAGAKIRIVEDGRVILLIGAADIGQGSDTVFAQIVAEELGISMESIKVIGVDTDVCPMDLGAYASRQTYVGGLAVKEAAVKCREKLLDMACKQFSVPIENLECDNGFIIDKFSKETIAGISELSLMSCYNKEKPFEISEEVYNSPKTNAYSFGVNFAEVEVNMKTGEVEVKGIWAIHDSGKIMNPTLAQGQVFGGVCMGIAYALLEELIYDSNTGRILNNNLLDYKIPTIMDVPPIHITFVETEEPSSAYGVKSLGEPPILSTAPAVRNAILNATGIGLNSLPMNPQRVLKAIKEKPSMQVR